MQVLTTARAPLSPQVLGGLCEHHAAYATAELPALKTALDEALPACLPGAKGKRLACTSTGSTTQSFQQPRVRSAAPTALEQQLARREDASTARGEIDGQSPPHNSPRGNDSLSRPPALKPSGLRARGAQAPAWIQPSASATNRSSRRPR